MLNDPACFLVLNIYDNLVKEYYGSSRVNKPTYNPTKMNYSISTLVDSKLC
jgi:hypothetical protein